MWLSLVERFVRDVAPVLLEQLHILVYRDVAQLGRALASGARGRAFESRHSDFFMPSSNFVLTFSVYSSINYIVME